MNKQTKLTFLATVLLAVSAFGLGPNGTTANLTVQNSAANSGTCTASSCVQQALQVQNGTVFTPTWSVVNTVSVQITGTWSGTVTFQEAQDEAQTWNNVPCQPVLQTATSVTPVPVTSTTANGNWQCDVGGFTSFRAVMSTFSSGSAVVVLESYAAVGNDSINALPLLTDSQERFVQGASQGVSYNITTSHDAGVSANCGLDLQAPPDGGIVYVREIDICLDALALQTTAAPRKFGVFSTTAAPAATGAVVQAPQLNDQRSVAYPGAAYVQSGATPLTTTPVVSASAPADSSLIDAFSLMMPAAATALNPNQCIIRRYDGTQGLQPIAFGGATAGASGANLGDAGICIADLTGGAGGVGGEVISVKFSVEPK